MTFCLRVDMCLKRIQLFGTNEHMQTTVYITFDWNQLEVDARFACNEEKKIP